MARKHVELHYRGFDAVNRRDLDAYLALMRGDVVVNSRLVAVEGIYQGHHGVRRWWADLLEVLPDFSAEASEIRDLGDVTLAVTCVRGHGAGSDVPIELTLFQVAEWHDEKVTRWSAYLSEAEALAAAGSR